MSEWKEHNFKLWSIIFDRKCGRRPFYEVIGRIIYDKTPKKMARFGEITVTNYANKDKTKGAVKNPLLFMC
jgi:hypothetical protein